MANLNLPQGLGLQGLWQIGEQMAGLINDLMYFRRLISTGASGLALALVAAAFGDSLEARKDDAVLLLADTPPDVFLKFLNTNLGGMAGLSAA